MLSQEKGIFYGLRRIAEKRHLIKQMKKMKIPYLYVDDTQSELLTISVLFFILVTIFSENFFFGIESKC